MGSIEKNKHFDREEQVRCHSLLRTNPLADKIKFQQYINKHPQSYSDYIYYIRTLITLRELEKAEETLNRLEQLILLDKKYETRVEEKYKKKIRDNIVIIKLILLYHHGMYQDAYDLYHKQDQKFQQENTHLAALIFYCRNKIGKVNQNIRDKVGYIFSQIIDYSEKDFLEHIGKHFSEFTSSDDEEVKSRFNIDFDLLKVLAEVRKHMNDNTRLYPFLYTDSYVFKYDGCGLLETGEVVDYFRIVCLHDTTNIITMYPAPDSKDYPYIIDLNYLKISDKGNKHVLSRSARFEKKFGLK